MGLFLLLVGVSGERMASEGDKARVPKATLVSKGGSRSDFAAKADASTKAC